MTVSTGIASADAKRLAVNLERLLRDVEVRVDEALADGALDVAQSARDAIESGGRSGRQYRRRGAIHVASAPGEPPAEESGRLAASIDVEQGGQMAIHHVTVGAPYAVALEFGSRFMLPRPFLRPALDENRDRIRRAVLDAAQAAVKGRGGVS